MWRGICYEGDSTKNCAYEGKAIALDAEGVTALKQWCSHLLPANYTDGQDVLTCCDNKQVRNFRCDYKLQSLTFFFPPS